MDEGRLGAVRRQQHFHRKNMIVMNDIINYRQNMYSCYLNKERQNTEARLKAQEVYMKKSIVRNNFLLQCMESRKQKVAEKSPDKLTLGRYGGRPINAFSKDVDAHVAWIHPRLRRLRKVERLKQKLGAAIDFATMQERIDAILHKTPERPAIFDTEADAKEEPKGSRGKPPPLNSRLNGAAFSDSAVLKNTLTANSIYSVLNTVGHARGDEKQMDQSRDSLQGCVVHSDIVGENRHLTDNDKVKITTAAKDRQNGLTDDVTLNHVSGQSASKTHVTGEQAKHPPPLIRRPTLVLPPIKSTKEMKMHGFDGF